MHRKTQYSLSGEGAMEAVGVGGVGGGKWEPRTVPATRLQTPNSRSSSLRGKKGQCETDSRKGGDEGSREEGEEAGEEGGKEGGEKNTRAQRSA